MNLYACTVHVIIMMSSATLGFRVLFCTRLREVLTGSTGTRLKVHTLDWMYNFMTEQKHILGIRDLYEKPVDIHQTTPYGAVKAGGAPALALRVMRSRWPYLFKYV